MPKNTAESKLNPEQMERAASLPSSLGSRLLLPVLMLLYSMNFMDRSVISIVGDAIKSDLGLTDAQMGMLHSVLLIMLIFLLVPGAALGDILGRRPLLSAAAGIWTGAMGLVASAGGFGQLLIGRALACVNEAVAGAGSVAWLSSYFPAEKRGGIIGLFQMSAPLGMAGGMFLGGIMLSLTGNWRSAWYIFLLPGLFCCLIIPKLPNRQVVIKKGYFKSFPELLKKKTIVICGLGGGMYCVAKFAYQTWYPVLLLRSYPEIQAVTAGTIIGAFLLAGGLGPMLGGYFSDWLSKKNRAGRAYALVICLLLMTISKFILYYLTGKVSIALLCCLGTLDGILTMAPLPIYFTMTQDVVSDRLRGTACGIMGGIVYLCGGAWGPFLAGIFSDYFGGGAAGLRLAELSLLIFPLLGVLIFACAIKPYSRENLTQRVTYEPS